MYAHIVKGSLWWGLQGMLRVSTLTSYGCSLCLAPSAYAHPSDGGCLHLKIFRWRIVYVPRWLLGRTLWEFREISCVLLNGRWYSTRGPKQWRIVMKQVSKESGNGHLDSISFTHCWEVRRNYWSGSEQRWIAHIQQGGELEIQENSRMEIRRSFNREQCRF